MTRLLTFMLLLLGLAFWMTIQARGDESPPTPGEGSAASAPDDDSNVDDAKPEGVHSDDKAGEDQHKDDGEGHVAAESAVTPESILEKFDANHDGSLSKEELAASLAASHEPGDLHKEPGHEDSDEPDHQHGDADPHGADHSEEHGDVSPLPFDPDLAIFTVIVFVILLAVLGKFAWGPIIDGLDKRENSVAEQIEQAKENNEKAIAMLAEYEERLAAASNEAKEMVEEARRDSESTRERIVAEAEAAATREKERALEAIQLAKESALHDLTKQSVDQAVALAKGIVRREVKAEDHAQLIQETLDKFPSRN